MRAVSAPDTPFDGLLARGPDDRTVLLVDRGSLTEWSGWSVDDKEHVLSLLDVVRHPDGHDVVFPLLSERLDRFVARRTSAGVPLTDGELVTIGVSVLRGTASAGGVDRAQWWLDDDGRPVLVPGRGDGDAYRAGAEALRGAAAASPGPVADVLGEVADALGGGRRRERMLVDAENALFAAATAEPLATSVLAPLREAARAAAPLAPAISDAAPPRPWWRSLAGHFDAGLADAASDAAQRMRRRFTAARAPRRAPVLLAAAVAVVVLAGGLLWPDSDEAAAGPSSPGPATAAASSPGESAHPDAASSHPPSEPPPDPPADVPAADAGPEAILSGLLDSRAACADAACLAGAVESPTRALAFGAIDLPAAERTVTLVDDLGGLVVLRVVATDASGASQIVTIVETPEGWRIRDAYLVADPPS